MTPHGSIRVPRGAAGRLASVACLSGLLLALAAAPATAQVPGPPGQHVADPAIDLPDQPFSFPSHPTDVIGVMDGRGTEVTPHGARR